MEYEMEMEPEYLDAITPKRKTPERFDEEGLNWLLYHGYVPSYYGGKSPQTQIHLLSCGINYTSSGPVEAGVYMTFAGTFAESKKTPAVVARVNCNCGRVRETLAHEPLPLGDLFAQVSAFAVAGVPASLMPSNATVGSIWSVEQDWNKLKLVVREVNGEVGFALDNSSPIVDWAELEYVFGSVKFSNAGKKATKVKAK